MQNEPVFVGTEGRETYMCRLTDRIEAMNSPLGKPDLKYLEEAKDIIELDFISSVNNPPERVPALINEIINHGPAYMFGGTAYLVLLVTSPEYPLLAEELGKLTPLMDKLQESGTVTFDFGTRHGLNSEVELFIIKSI